MPQKNYEVVARLADRGIGEVFVARMAEDGGTRPVLIERLSRARAADSDVVRGFLERARVGFQLAHPNIAQVLDVGRLGSTYYLSLEYLDGESVRAVIDHARAREKLQIPVRAVLTIAAGVASALRHAHGRQDGDGRELVHGNLSPTSLMINRDGVVKVTDYGLAAEEQLPAYQSPEQVRGDAIDRRSDLFSLGTVLWELLTREPLFKRASSVDTLAAVESDAAPPPSIKRMDVPHELDTIVGKLLEKEPAERYQDADDLLVDIEALATKLAFQISTTDLSRMLRLWFGNKPNPAVLNAQVVVVPEDLASDGPGEETELDRQLDEVTPPPDAGVPQRSDTTTPPPATVEPPTEPKESFEQIRDRILGARTSNDTSGPRAKAYTNPAIPLDGPRTTTLPFGMSPTAITDVISRVTQAASAQGAAVRSAVAKKTDLLPTEVKKTEAMETEPEQVTLHLAKPTIKMGSLPTESAEVKEIEAVERKLIETPMEAKPTESMEPARNVHTAQTRQMEAVVEPISEAKPMKAAAVRLDDTDPKARGQEAEHKEHSAQLVLPRTQSTEWFERGEREAKEAHAQHAKELAEAREAPRRPRTPSMIQSAHDEDEHRKARSQAHRKSGIVLAALAAVAAVLVVVAIAKFAHREKPAKTMPVAGSAQGSDLLAGSAETGSAAIGSGSDMLAGSAGSAIGSAGAGSDIGSAAAGSAMLAGSDTLAGSGSAAQVAAVIPDAAPPVDAAVIAPPIDAAQVAAVPVDAARAVPVDAAKVAVVDAAKPPVDAARVATVTPDAHVEPKKPDHKTETKPKTETKEPPASIDTLFAKGDFAKADKACATNTQFNASILEMCFLSACQVKDTGLANRWIHAIARSQRESLAAKCKDAGLEIAVP